MIIVAHRGQHGEFYAPNTWDSIDRALKNGFGVEIDLRMGKREREIVLSHDTPPPEGAQKFEDLVSLFCTFPDLPILCNIKEDGLGGLLAGYVDQMKAAGCCFRFFDMGVPEHLTFQRKAFPCLMRLSDVEREVDLKHLGIWFDGFFVDYPAAPCLRFVGNDLFFVSPELHGRDPGPFWGQLREWERQGYFDHAGVVGICTDLFWEAKEFFQCV